MLVSLLMAWDVANCDKTVIAGYANRERAKRIAARLSREQPNDDGYMHYYVDSITVKERRHMDVRDSNT